MAMRYGYFDSEITGVDENGMPIFDRAETSDLFRMLFANLVSNGVLATPGDCFQVVAGAGMTVRIRPGFAMIKGAFAYDADEATVTLAAANANLPRVDRVVLRCNYHDRCCEIIVKTGTPSTVPVAPELLQPKNGDYYELGLALITVAANQSAITQSSITDTRADSSVCGLITQLIDHIDTSEFMQQLTTWQEEYAAEQQAAFSTWFEAMKDQLSEDAAGNLQLEIDNLSQSAEAHEESIGQINEIIGDADMGSTDPTIRGAIREILNKIGDVAMGTTAGTVTGAINELHDKVDADIPDLISDSISNALNSALKWKLFGGKPNNNYVPGQTFVTVPASAKEVYVIVYIKWTTGDKVMVDFHIPVEPYAFGSRTNFAQHVKFYGTNHDGYVCIEARTTDGTNFMRLYESRNGSTDVTSSTYCAYMYR